MADQAIIIKRVKKVDGGHHGGAWKVAYADFVTAMMAFFLMLWLLNSVTEEQLTGISNYFAPTVTSTTQGGSNALFGGDAMGPPGALSKATAPSLVQHLPPPSVGPGGDDLTIKDQTIDEDIVEPEPGVTEEKMKEVQAEREQQKFEKAKEMLEQAIHNIPELKKFEGSMLVDNTPEGLRIQITDQDGLAMFPSGSSAMYGHTYSLLNLVARIVNQLPNRISISGHTDSVPFRGESGYSNWELSADRALASRRALLNSGVAPQRIDRVVGKSDTDPLVMADQKSPRNRRIGIILLRENEPVPQTVQPQALVPSGGQ